MSDFFFAFTGFFETVGKKPTALPPFAFVEIPGATKLHVKLRYTRCPKCGQARCVCDEEERSKK